MTSQEGGSLLKSCAGKSFSFTCGNLQAFATHGLRNTNLTFQTKQTTATDNKCILFCNIL